MSDITVVIGSGVYDTKTEHGAAMAKRFGLQDSLIPGQVLAHTIREHASEDVRIIDTYSMRRPDLRRVKQPTPFSLVRLWVPELMDYRGKAIYLDADMLVFSDIRDLFELGAVSAEKPIYRTPGCTSVLVYDCASINWNAREIAESIDAGRESYARAVGGLMGISCGLLPESWNHRDRFTPGETNLLHFTALGRQPWRNAGHELEYLWRDALRDAVESGAVDPAIFSDRIRECYEKSNVGA